MARKIFMVLVLGMFIGAIPGAALAGYDSMSEYKAEEAQKSAESVSTVDADQWPISEPVETGAVPGMSDSSEPAGCCTSVGQFPPPLDAGGGGE